MSNDTKAYYDHLDVGWDTDICKWMFVYTTEIGTTHITFASYGAKDSDYIVGILVVKKCWILFC